MADTDSRMADSPEASDVEEVETPAGQMMSSSSVLSPPDSQHSQQGNSSSSFVNMPTSASGVAGANANGKRPITTISNGADDDILDGGMAVKPKGPDFPPRTHQPSGYTWSRVEDEPGYAWLNKKAMDERNRAVDALVHREQVVMNRYGDPFEAAEREQALLNSLKQR
ncbi:hypothetical protein BAUCODRAFT_62368 [Baudoinia panamericana UAMH 10762]|uniref:Uncharacterized protein n=1 Tax=Baudoinia panamericana (strain UAMH 10762) TaxID=717646 RepID=M2N9S2_BAUPA|nr:uncharacterized protein BAUCODRAFT_62368 [Baudoinia panamericana UAMH 10762]EMD00949.1 hypothetical protein BAUCODRAFT_62368 [Baudoinia panamericana UAMH 10762]